MSSDDFEKRINNQLATIVENQARFDAEMVKMQEAIGGLIQVARLNTEQIQALVEQGGKQDERISAIAEQGRDQQEKINALIRIVEGHVTNHP